jgi:hypothetical protein
MRSPSRHIDGDVARSERAIERGDALVEIAGELLEALISRCEQAERAACRVARAGQAAGAIR